MKRLIATPDGAGQWSGHPAFRTALANIVTPATRAADRCDGFQPMEGFTIAQTVSMKIHGAHMPHHRGTRQGASSIYAAY